ncbi:MAG: glycosyltransferase, partial [Candidatus Woesearchaeota archaeon]|nr:glycosyltransferase [Candidatus Woesearchaeota archaeon]
AILDHLHLAFDKIFYVFLYATIGLTIFYLILSVLAMIPRKKREEKGFDMSKAPFVTIQIPTRNEIIALRCAQRCLEFDYPKDRYEILIGDDSNDKSVSKRLKEFADIHNNVNVIKRKQNTGFKPGNLNNMLDHSRGEILVIFDSDFTPESDFLRRIVAPFVRDKNVSAVQARWNFNNFDQNLITVLSSTIVHVFHHVVLSFMDRFETGSLCGSAEAIRKKDLIRLGKWRSGSLTEDVEYSLRLHKEGKKIIYLEGLECYSDVPFKATDLYKQQMRWAYGVVAAYICHTKDILFSRATSAKMKLLSFCAGFGYTLPVMIISLFIFGTFSFVTNRPAPIDLPKFFSELALNILLTSGLIIASMVSLYKVGKSRYLFKMLLSSFSIGIVTTLYVNKGIFKSIFGEPMEWFLLNKNTDVSSVK